jgi:DNA-binding CsgD family transcriptional regulator
MLFPRRSYYYVQETRKNKYICSTQIWHGMIELELVEFTKIEILRLIHLFMCLFGGVFIIIIWFKAIKNADHLKQDLGLIFISCALFLWVAMDLYRFLGLMKPGYVSLVIKTFSAYNNGFFLASLPFFSHSFVRLKEKFPLFRNKMKWALFILLLNIAFVFFYSFFWGEKQGSSAVVNYFDFIYSTLTYVLLSSAIIQTFKNRQEYRQNFFYVAIFLSILLIVAQVGFSPIFSITNYDSLSVIAFSSQCLLILVFVFLGQAWILDYVVSVNEQQKLILTENYNKAKEELTFNRNELEKISFELRELKEKSEVLKSNLIEKETTIKTSQQIKELSDRELEVLSLIDRSYSEIGNLLHIARETVISHKKNIESKLGISNKLQLIEYANSIGILKRQ